MFRDNEASRVGAVLACKEAGDVAGTIARAQELWLAPREHADTFDEACAEVWDAIVALRAEAAAVEAARVLFRAGVKIRSHAFIDLTEAMTEPQLVETLDHALAAGWDVHPYLAAVFLRFAEAGRGDALLAAIRARAPQLRADTARWTLVVFVLAVSGVGGRAELDAWFAHWTELADVPMWIVATYIGSLARLHADHLARIADLAARAYTRTKWDATTAYFIPLLGVDALLRGARDEFLSRVRSATAIGGAARPPEPIDNPIVRYANGAKHRYAVTAAELAWDPDEGARIVDNRILQAAPQPREWRLVLTLRALADIARRGERILPLFAQMIDARRGDPAIVGIYRTMQRAHLSDWPPLEPLWKRLARERVPPWQRFKLEFFD